MTSLAIGAVLGLIAGFVPGPFLTLVATTSVRNGLGAGLRVAVVPLGTELPALVGAIFLLTRLFFPSPR
jgi:threonine/homoserine/homoserine lactone efflux protein